jgi:nitroimidazol reductase NimA-like FMN-containing flavoprotein (pyridoxamine 5'-phosphate oxidase superfamily)
MDWKYFIIAIIMVLLGCAVILVPPLSRGSGTEAPALRILKGNGAIEIGDHHGYGSAQSSHREIVRLPAMSADEVERLLESQKICRMALNDTPQPYIIAMDYIYLDGRLYFHFADYGRKMDLIRSDPHVTVEIDNFCEGTRDFYTITLMGQLEKVTDKMEGARVARALVDSAKTRGGVKNVAARHGLRSLDSGGLMSEPSTMYRLVVSDSIELKSPG